MNFQLKKKISKLSTNEQLEIIGILKRDYTLLKIEMENDNYKNKNER